MRVTKALLTIFLAGCASQSRLVHVAPTNDTVTTTTEDGMGSTPAHNIYVINASTVPIVVFGVALRDCENLKQQCEPRPLDMKIDGGQRRIVLRVEPRDPHLAFSYRFSYSWRPEKQ